MNNPELIEKLNDHDVQISRLYWMPAIEHIVSNIDDLSDALYQEDNKKIAEIFSLDDNLAECLEDYDLETEVEGFIGWLLMIGKTGFIAELQIPVKKNFSQDGVSCSFNYGHCYCPIIYADTFEQLIDKAIELEKKYEDDDRMKWQQAKEQK